MVWNFRDGVSHRRKQLVNSCCCHRRVADRCLVPLRLYLVIHFSGFIVKHIFCSHHLQLFVDFQISEMSLPVEKGVSAIRLTNVVDSLLIDKYLEEASSTALAISEAFDGFYSSVYKTSRFELILFNVIISICVHVLPF